MKIEIKEFSGQKANSVNARNLYDFLEVGYQFVDWIKIQTEELELTHNIDYISFSENLKNLQGGRPSVNYYLTIDTAKNIAVNTKTKKSKKIILEYIKKLEGSKSVQNLSRKEILSMALQAEEENERLKADLQYKDAVLSTQSSKIKEITEINGLVGFRQMAKELHIKEDNLKQFLLDNQIIYYLGGKMTAHSSGIARKLAEVKLVNNARNGESYDQVFFTSKCKELVLKLVLNINNAMSINTSNNVSLNARI